MKSTADSVQYSSRRVFRPDERAEIQVDIGAPIRDPGTLDLFLTARFRLYARRRDQPVTAPIAHQEWPLQHARVVQMEQTLIQASGLPAPRGVPIVHFSRRVDVLAGWPESLSRG